MAVHGYQGVLAKGTGYWHANPDLTRVVPLPMTHQGYPIPLHFSNVYECHLILKYINNNGTDPLTSENPEESDLLTIKAGVSLESHVLNALTPFYPIPDPKAAPPCPPAASSIPIPLQNPSKRMGHADPGELCSQTAIQ